MAQQETRELIKDLLDRLEKLVTPMDVKAYKRRNPSWLQKNMADRNSKHPNFEEASTIVEELLKHGVSHG
jgi:hypothetical protein